MLISARDVLANVFRRICRGLANVGQEVTLYHRTNARRGEEAERPTRLKIPLTPEEPLNIFWSEMESKHFNT